MTTLSTTIKGYTVDLDTDQPTTQCFVTKGPYSASLEAMSQTGMLTWDHREHAVPGSILGDIENWAYNNGY